MTARLVANELAREDWRDALVVAGLGGSDWPAKLNEALGRPRISPRLWTYPFHAQSWDEIQDEYTALASRDTSLAAWAAIANSVGASPAKGQLAGRLRQTMECGLVVVAEMPVAQEAHFRKATRTAPAVAASSVKASTIARFAGMSSGTDWNWTVATLLEDGGAFMSMRLSRFVWLSR
jgi:hypothetical protein